MSDLDTFVSRPHRYGPLVDKQPLTTGFGAAGAGRIIATGADGKVDSSLLPDAGASTFAQTITASGAVSGQRVIKANGDGTASHASSMTTADAAKVIGITTGTAADGATATYQAQGTITEGSWAWSPGPVFLALNGQLTQIQPVSGFILRVATAINATVLQVDIGIAIILA